MKEEKATEARERGSFNGGGDVSGKQRTEPTWRRRENSKGRVIHFG